MDWTAKVLGLDHSFYNTSEVGGGVIQVNSFAPDPNTTYQNALI